MKRQILRVLLLAIATSAILPAAMSFPADKSISVEEDQHLIEPETEVVRRKNSHSEKLKSDKDCDCEDPDALYHKTLRQIINEQGLQKMRDLLKDIRPKRVCGSDGEWYTIKCQLLCTKQNNPEKADLKAVKSSFCRKLKSKRPHVCICPRNFAPVCASNGVTYGNKCAFECAKHYVCPDIQIVALHKCHEEDRTAI